MATLSPEAKADLERIKRKHAREAKLNGGAVVNDRLRLSPLKSILFTTAATYLVKSILPRIGLAVVWGPPKCGKSFLAFDMMMHVALGWPYRGHRVRQGPVVYLALEGVGGLAARVEAWRRHHGIAPDADVPLYLLTRPVDLIAEHAELIKAIAAQLPAKPVAVVIDTLARALAGSENRPEDMARFIRAADAIREAFDCCVIVVHHCGHEASRPRGHTSLPAADDAQIAVDKDDGGGIVTATIKHMKDGDTGTVIVSRLNRVDLGVDDDGDPITSCVIVPVDGATARATIRATIRLSADQRRFFDILNDAIADVPAEHKSTDNIPAGRIGITREWLKMCCKSKGWFDPEASDNSNRARVSRTLNALAGKRLIGLSNLYVWNAE